MPPPYGAQLNRIEAKVATLAQAVTEMRSTVMDEMKTLQDEVERNTSVDQSAVTLLTGLAAKIEAMKTDPVALQSFADSLRNSSDALAAAVVANTPAADA